MGQRGFTLFTALIAFILIVLSLVLVQSMTSTEASVSEIVSDISEQQEMQAIADLVRADALQSFNYGVRYSIEEFTGRNEYLILTNTIRRNSSKEENWRRLKADFISDRFGVRVPEITTERDDTGNQFARLAANNLVSIIETTSDARGYAIDLENVEPGSLTQALDDTLQGQVDREEEFATLFKCETANYEECTGTFYVTMDLSPASMPDSLYERFPLVTVTNAEGRTLKEPILPRGKFSIYIPIRMFKALSGAQEISEAVLRVPDGTLTAGNAGETIEAAIAAEGFAQEYSTGDGFTFVGATVNAIPVEAGSDRLRSIEVAMEFEETDTKYKINDTRELVYKIRFRRDFI